jgi:hypothetical protein
MRITLMLFIIAVITVSVVSSYAGREEITRTTIRTSEDAEKEGKVRCINIEIPGRRSYSDDDIEVEYKDCFFTKKEAYVLERTFMTSLREAAEIPPGRPLTQYTGLQFTNIRYHHVIKAMALTAEKMKTEYNCDFSANARKMASLASRQLHAKKGFVGGLYWALYEGARCKK